MKLSKQQAEWIAGGVVALIVIVALATANFHPKPANSLGVGIEIKPNATTTNASTTVGTGIVKIFSDNTAAVYRSICNTGTGTLYLWANSTSTGMAAGGPAGRSVFTSTCHDLIGGTANFWAGNIYGTMSNGSTTITYQER